MVTSETAFITCELECNICGEKMGHTDKCVVVVRHPTMDAHAICLEDWGVILACASAYLRGFDQDDPDALKRATAAAVRHFTDDPDQTVDLWPDPPKNA